MTQSQVAELVQKICARARWASSGRHALWLAGELDAAMNSGQATGSNGEPLLAVPTCPKCGSKNGSLGTSNAYFVCRDCKQERYWTDDYEHPKDWPTAVALSPFGRRSVLLDEINILRAKLGEGS